MRSQYGHAVPVPWDQSKAAEIDGLTRKAEDLRRLANALHAQAQALSRYGDEGARRFQIEMQVSTLRADAREIAERVFDLSEKRTAQR